MSQVKVTFKKVPELGKLVLVTQGDLNNEEGCNSCMLDAMNNGIDRACTVIDARTSCIDRHWQKVKP